MPPRKTASPSGSGTRRCEFCNSPSTAKNPVFEIQGQDVCANCVRENEEQLAEMLVSLRADDPTASPDDAFGTTPMGMAVDALVSVRGGGRSERARSAAAATAPHVHAVPSPKEIKAVLDQYVVGQERAKRVLSVAVHSHYKRIFGAPAAAGAADEAEFRDVELEKSNILLVGPTGSGKTLLARTLARLLDVPFAIADATTLTEAGYVGEDVENILLNLLQAADMNVKRAEKGIVFVDEIDKIARKTGNVSITRDVSGEGVQQALLKIVEGTLARVPPAGGRKHPEQKYIEIQTKDILFICGGAFVGLDKIAERRSRDRHFGFAEGAAAAAAADAGAPAPAARAPRFETEDFIEFGLIPEFVGRLPVVTTLDELSEDDLVRVLTEPKNSLVKQYRKLFRLEGIDLQFEPDAVRELAKEAVSRKTGARGLRAILEELMNDLLFEAGVATKPDAPAAPKALRTLRLTGGLVRDRLDGRADLAAALA